MNSKSAALTVLLAIAGTSAAIDDASDIHKIQKTAQKNLKARRLYDQGEKMSMDSAEDSLGSGVEGWFGHAPSPTPNPPAPADGIACPSSSPGHYGLPHGCAPKGNECKGFSYYTVRGESPWTWHDALDATPENCILAPIGSEVELAEVIAQYKALGSSGRAWLGVRKSAFDVENDNNGDGSRANWFNLDGTPATVCAESAWRTNQPDNPTGSAQYLDMRFTSGELSDCLAGCADKVSYAIYKCCKEGVTFTPASCGVATADD